MNKIFKIWTVLFLGFMVLACGKAFSADASYTLNDYAAQTAYQVKLSDNENGTYSNSVNVSSQSITIPFLQQVAEGSIPGYSLERKFGYNPTLAAGVDADIWEYGATDGAQRYTFSADGVADIDSLTSDDTLDTDIEITIEGLAIDGSSVIQTTTTHIAFATNTVTLDTPLWRVNRVYNTNGTTLQGNIYVFVSTPTTAGVPDDVTAVRGYVSIGNNQTLQAVYTVPLGKTAYIYNTKTSIVKKTAGYGIFTGTVREFGKVFRTREIFGVLSVGTSRTFDEFQPPIVLPAKTDLRPTVDSDSTMGFSTSYAIVLKDN